MLPFFLFEVNAFLKSILCKICRLLEKIYQLMLDICYGSLYNIFVLLNTNYPCLVADGRETING